MYIKLRQNDFKDTRNKSRKKYNLTNAYFHELLEKVI